MKKGLERWPTDFCIDLPTDYLPGKFEGYHSVN